MFTPWSATVLCAVDGCNHLDCHGGNPFRVALVDIDAAGTTHAALYSSETEAWSSPASIDHHPDDFIQARRPSVLVENALYFLCDNNTSIVKFDMATMTLSVVYKFDNTLIRGLQKRFTIDDKIRGLQLMTTSNNTLISENRDQKQGTMRQEALTTPSTPTTLLCFVCCSSAPPGGESLARFSFFLVTSSSSAANISNSRCACSMAVASPGTYSCFSCSAPWLSSAATISRTSCLDRAARVTV
ncbi:hypothetical protein [Oryza sativa (japonica cultivar-group)]|uniref:Uncharacterized protein B1046G12.38 n=2 Tax=Oryza sativa subsp. japonica TaxID=39947 RepID=Q4VWZ0_ORYSJ|nr:hypothetical protein [Oryza sativa Japonica Group]